MLKELSILSLKKRFERGLDKFPLCAKGKKRFLSAEGEVGKREMFQTGCEEGGRCFRLARITCRLW